MVVSCERFAAVCGEDSVGSGHNCSDRKIVSGRPQDAIPGEDLAGRRNLVVEDDIEEGAVHVQALDYLPLRWILNTSSGFPALVSLSFLSEY